MKLSIPGFNKNLILEHLALDFNGTLAIDGKLIRDVKELLTEVAKQVTVHVITGNTFGTAKEELRDIPCKIVLLPGDNQGIEKGKLVVKLGPNTVISIGNGRNDCLMLKTSAIGIVVVQKEGASVETLMAADIICHDIISALELITNPLRLVATLRNQ